LVDVVKFPGRAKELSAQEVLERLRLAGTIEAASITSLGDASPNTRWPT
jgi:hypothetical protein